MFSNRERELIKIIGNKKMKLSEIADKFFEGEKPFNGDISIGNSIRRIILKCKYYKYDWTLKKERVDNKITFTKEIL